MLVLIAAKAIGLWGRELPQSWTTPVAYLWHDVAVVLLFWLVDGVIRRPRVMWLLYVVLVAYAALNVPVVRVLSSPLTVPMLRAAGAPLLDSVTHYLTAGNLLAIASVLVTGIVSPWLGRRLGMPRRAIVWSVVVAVLVSGPIATARIDTVGLHRNAVTSLLATAWPRVAARRDARDWRASPFDTGAGQDLAALRGVAAGRNVVLILLESTGAQYLAFHGAAEDPTPNVTALARHGLVFEDAYAVYPESIKGLFATLCARAPAFDVDAGTHARAPCDPLPQILSRAGYRTGIFHSGRFTYLGMEDVVAQQGFATAEDAGAIGGNVQSSFGVDEPATVARMLDWIDGEPGSRPFLLAYLPAAGHHPYATVDPGPFDDSTTLGAYRNALHEGDRAIGTLLAGLRARSLDTRTLFVIAGDHGEAFGQHPGNFGHSLFIYDENIRVPFVVAAPGAIPPGRVERIASSVDTAPTVLDLLGLPASTQHEGASLLDARRRMALFYTDYALGWLGLRDGCWKFMFALESRRSQLFDLCADPGETADRSAGHPDRVAAYRDRVERWSSAQREAIVNRRPIDGTR